MQHTEKINLTRAALQVAECNIDDYTLELFILLYDATLKADGELHIRDIIRTKCELQKKYSGGFTNPYTAC